MEDAIPLFLGKHDYRAFMSSGSPVPNTCRTLDKLTLTRNGALLHLDFEAESFLYNQVRIITGTLVAIGLGRMQPAQAKRALDEGIRRLAGPTMPPQGLTLMEVLYDGEEER
jgi:tRNA pseudouridine38-40 synthase